MTRSLIQIICLCFSLSLPVAVQAQHVGVVDHAFQALEELRIAVRRMRDAASPDARVQSLTKAIRAYEESLSALRGIVRQVHLREQALKRRIASKRERISLLLTRLTQIQNSAGGASLLLHPDGPLGAVRAATLLTAASDDLEAEAKNLEEELRKLAELERIQQVAREEMLSGQGMAQHTRVSLSKAISKREKVPKKFLDDPTVLEHLLATVSTLETFTRELALENVSSGFKASKGKLPLPAVGTLLRKFDEADARGVRRPGITLAVPPSSLVRAPWQATIRYAGPLYNYGNVIIQEPGDGYLLIFSGLGVLYAKTGDVVEAGAPLGLLPIEEEQSGNVTKRYKDTAGGETESLYIELRERFETQDPIEWFLDLKE